MASIKEAAMIVQTNAEGFVENYAIIGTVEGGIEVSQPSDLDHFEVNFTAYRVRDGDLVFDETKQKALGNTQAVEKYRWLREAECFSIINRGQLWYEALTDAQRDELRQWYQAWLDGTDTLVVPERPVWLQ
jgi:predicted outer membrane lipoprotein